MKISWEVEDGYVGKLRPQYTEVPDDEIAECETVEEADALIEEYVCGDFDYTITWCFSNYENMIKEVEELIKRSKEHDMCEM